MNVPKKITIEWLRRTERGRDPNSYRMVKERKLALIPEKHWKKFIAMPCRAGTILQAIACHFSLSYVPKHVLTADNLTDIAEEGDPYTSPLETLALNDQLHQVPWEIFSARKSSGHLKHLKRVREIDRQTHPTCNELAELIEKIEALKKMEEKRNIEIRD